MALFATLISIDTLAQSMSLLYKGTNFTIESYKDLKINHKLTKELYGICSDIVEDLQQMEEKFIHTGRARQVLHSVIEALDLCKKYEKKNHFLRFFTSTSDKKTFYFYRIRLYIYFVELEASISLTDENHNEMVFIT